MYHGRQKEEAFKPMKTWRSVEIDCAEGNNPQKQAWFKSQL